MLSPFAPEREVIPPDEREMVRDSLAVPYRWVCSLDVTHPDGAFARGSGVLVGPRQVLTAAHNIYRPDGSSPSSVHVAVARHGRSEPFGRVKAVAFSLTSAYLGASRAGTRFDFAVVTLDRDVGSRTHAGLAGGVLGHWGHPTQGHRTVLRPLDAAFLAGKRVEVCGYPGDYCGRQRLEGDPCARERVGPARGCATADHATVPFVHHGSARFRAGLTGILLHTADTKCGQSGSPVWIAFSDGSRWLVGVHVDANRVHDASTGRQLPVTDNRAVHLTGDVIQLVRGWMP